MNPVANWFLLWRRIAPDLAVLLVFDALLGAFNQGLHTVARWLRLTRRSALPCGRLQLPAVC
jgi:hypothetical protein